MRISDWSSDLCSSDLKEIRTKQTSESLSGTKVRKVSLPRYEDEGETLRFLMKENLPGYFPFTAGVFPFKRDGEDPTRMLDRKSVVSGKSVSVRVDLGGRRIITKKIKHKAKITQQKSK